MNPCARRNAASSNADGRDCRSAKVATDCFISSLASPHLFEDCCSAPGIGCCGSTSPTPSPPFEVGAAALGQDWVDDTFALFLPSRHQDGHPVAPVDACERRSAAHYFNGSQQPTPRYRSLAVLIARLRSTVSVQWHGTRERQSRPVSATHPTLWLVETGSRLPDSGYNAASVSPLHTIQCKNSNRIKQFHILYSAGVFKAACTLRQLSTPARPATPARIDSLLSPAPGRKGQRVDALPNTPCPSCCCRCACNGGAGGRNAARSCR